MFISLFQLSVVIVFVKSIFSIKFPGLIRIISSNNIPSQFGSNVLQQHIITRSWLQNHYCKKCLFKYDETKYTRATKNASLTINLPVLIPRNAICAISWWFKMFMPQITLSQLEIKSKNKSEESIYWSEYFEITRIGHLSSF